MSPSGRYGYLASDSAKSSRLTRKSQPPRRSSRLTIPNITVAAASTRATSAERSDGRDAAMTPTPASIMPIAVLGSMTMKRGEIDVSHSTSNIHPAKTRQPMVSVAAPRPGAIIVGRRRGMIIEDQRTTPTVRSATCVPSQADAPLQLSEAISACANHDQGYLYVYCD